MNEENKIQPQPAPEPKKPGFWRTVWHLKLYIILAIFLSGLFIVGNLSEEAVKEKQKAKEQTVKVQEKLKQAQTAFEEEVKEKGSAAKYFEKNPRQAQLFGYATLLLFALFLYGLWIDVWCLIRKSRGQPVLQTLDFIEAPKWQVLDVFKVMILFLFFSVFLAAIGEVAGRIWPTIFNDNGKLILHGTISDLIVLFLVLYFSKVKYGQSFFKIQIRKENLWKDIGIGFAAYVALFPIVIALLAILIWITSMMQYEPPPHKLVEVFIEESKQNPIIYIYGIILASFIGPMIEEIFFRGFFYSALRKSYAAIPSALVTAVFFGLLHQSAFAFVPIFVLSLFLTYLYEKRKSIVAPIAFHVFHNVLFLGYFVLMKESFLDKFLH